MSNRNVVSIFDSCNSGTVTRGLRREKVPVRTFPTGADSTASQAYLDTLDEGTIINSPAFQQSRNEDPFINSDRQRTVWSAASSSQFAYVNPYDPKRQGGKFTQILFDGYVRKKADRNRNGIITNSEMYNYAAQESAKFCKRIFRDRNTCFSGLTPVLSISPEQRNMKFGFPKPIVAQQVNQTSTVSDTLPETNAGDISLYIETSKGRTTQIPFEELVWVTAQPKKSGYLYLLDHDSDGEVRFLFPMGTEDNYIDAGTPVKFPDPKVHGFQIRAFKKGKSELVAVLVDDPIDTTQLMREVRDNKTITAKQLGDFASKIAAIHVGDRTNRINKYSTKRLPYVVK